MWQSKNISALCMTDEELMILDALHDPGFFGIEDNELEEGHDREPEIDEVNHDYQEWGRNICRPLVETEEK